MKKNYTIYFQKEGQLVEVFSFSDKGPWAKKVEELSVNPPPHRVFYHNALHSLWYQVMPFTDELYRSRQISGAELTELRKCIG